MLIIIARVLIVSRKAVRAMDGDCLRQQLEVEIHFCSNICLELYSSVTKGVAK